MRRVFGFSWLALGCGSNGSPLSVRAALTAILLTIARAIALLACSRNAAPPPAAPAGDDAGAPGCNPGEVARDDGTCQPAGIPPEMCAEGFRSDGQMGCDPILPAKPCPKGQMAVPGETQCRDVAPCADGNWGDIPVDASTQFVDRAYAGGGSNGTQARPWTKIGDAVKAAAPGAIVAIAAGSYAEDVAITGSVRLWGRCPKLVEIVGTGAAVAAVTITTGAKGTQLRDLSLDGASIGVALSGSRDIVLDRVWVHDTAGRGINAEGTYGPTSVTISRSLVENAQEDGVEVSGAEAVIEATAVRSTQPRASDMQFGEGIHVQDSSKAVRSTATIRGCVVEGNLDAGVAVWASDATIEATVVRDTQAEASDQQYGRGIDVESYGASRATATIRGCVVERNRDLGVFVGGSSATIEATVVRDTQPRASDLDYGFGILVERNPDTHAAGSLTVRASVVAGARAVGIAVFEADATITGTLVRDTKPYANDGAYGDGVTVVAETTAASVSVTGSRIGGSARAGLSIFGASAAASSSLFDCNGMDLNGETWKGNDYSFDTSAGGDSCGCANAANECQVLSSGLAPPKSLHSGK